MTATYTTRDEAIQREIVEPILAGDVETIEEYDVEAIAAAVLGDYSQGFACLVTPERFWEVVAEHFRQVRFDRDDIMAALHAAGIAYMVEHPRTEVESFHVTREDDGRVVAFGPGITETGEAGTGIDVAYYSEGADSDVRTQDWVSSPAQLIADLRKFLA